MSVPARVRLDGTSWCVRMLRLRRPTRHHMPHAAVEIPYRTWTRLACLFHLLAPSPPLRYTSPHRAMLALHVTLDWLETGVSAQLVCLRILSRLFGVPRLLSIIGLQASSTSVAVLHRFWLGPTFATFCSIAVLCLRNSIICQAQTYHHLNLAFGR
jgi:hypothetical protein